MRIQTIAKTKSIAETVSVLEEIYKTIGAITLDQIPGKYEIKFVMNKIDDNDTEQ